MMATMTTMAMMMLIMVSATGDNDDDRQLIVPTMIVSAYGDGYGGAVPVARVLPLRRAALAGLSILLVSQCFSSRFATRGYDFCAFFEKARAVLVLPTSHGKSFSCRRCPSPCRR